MPQVWGQSKTQIRQTREFDTYIQQAIQKWNSVGLAVTVVKNNEVLFEKGYGLRELNTKNAVDVNTLFACGSTTKAMTATCMGILVDQGKVRWDDPVIKYLPEFQLYDPVVTRDLTIRDLFLHNSGVGNTDFLWAQMNISNDEIMHRMRLVEPSYSFRNGFIYQNIFYLIAGKVIERISGQSWERFITDHIFKPLQMNDTKALLKEITSENKTKPHIRIDGELAVIEDLSADVIGPAGSVWASIHDISKWTMCMLDSGKHPGGRLVKAETWIKMTTPQTFVPPSQFYPTARITKPNWTTYGLGWFQHDFRGRKLNFHTGSLPGSIAIHGQLPEENIAVYVFGNTDHVEVRHAIMYKAFDVFALGGSTNWSSEFFNLYQELSKEQMKAKISFEEKRVKETTSSVSIGKFTGVYQNDLYGQIEVKASGEQLLVDINNTLTAKLTHWHYDTFRGVFDKRWFGEMTITFHMNESGMIDELVTDGVALKKVE